MIKNKFFLMGSVGFVVVFVLNLTGLFLLNQPAAAFFQDSWYLTWFPAYVVWLVMLVIGFGRSRSH